MDWLPTLDDHSGPVYQRIVEALASDIAQGRLRRGQQLPTHRALAQALGIDLTTVTRAYLEARRRGLTEARVGQGTFVAESMAQPARTGGDPIAFDLSMNLPPQPLAADLEGRITRGIAAIERGVGFSAYLNYREPGGSEHERRVAASWLGRRVAGAAPERLVICPGTQTALFVLLAALTKPGDIVFTEKLTYPGMKAASAYAGVRLVPVETDGDGMVPHALAEACKKHRGKAVYLIPTMHSPTTVTMSRGRRETLAETIAAQGLLLFEDDAYGALARDDLPLVSLIPERTYFASSLSKCIAPGLRVSLLLTPDRAAAATFANALRAAVQMPVSLMVALVTRWFEDGSADAIIDAIRDEATARQTLAAELLKGHAYAAHPNGHHIWVPLSQQWSRAEFAAHVQRQGLAVVTSEAFTVGDTPPHAIRVALGAASSRYELGRALDVLATALHGSAVARAVV